MGEVEGEGECEGEGGEEGEGNEEGEGGKEEAVKEVGRGNGKGVGRRTQGQRMVRTRMTERLRVRTREGVMRRRKRRV